MTRRSLQAVDEPSDRTDEELVVLARDGDQAAFARLYSRHIDVARSTAQAILGSRGEADDVAAESFARLLATLGRGRGPTEAFRPYLLTIVRNTCRSRFRARQRQQRLVDRIGLVEPMTADHCPDTSMVHAFRSLGRRSQQILWWSEVEQLDLSTVAARLDLSVAAAASAGYRARRALAEAYLDQHIARASNSQCQRVSRRLAQFVRGSASAAAHDEITSHLDRCDSCRTSVDDLADLNTSLRALAGPAAGVLATAAAGVAAGEVIGASGIVWMTKAAVAVLLAASPFTLAGSGRLPVEPDSGGAHRTVAGVVPGTWSPADPGPVAAFPLPAPVADPTAPTAAEPPSGRPTPRSIAAAAAVAVDVVDLGPPSSTIAVDDAHTDPVEPTPAATTAIASTPTVTVGAPPPASPLAVSPAATALPILPVLTLAPLPLPDVSVVLPELSSLPGLSSPAISLPGISLPGISLPPSLVPVLAVPVVPTSPIPVPTAPIVVPSAPASIEVVASIVVDPIDMLLHGVDDIAPGVFPARSGGPG